MDKGLERRGQVSCLENTTNVERIESTEIGAENRMVGMANTGKQIVQTDDHT